ncbi:RHS repeat-associated core domain-containing protein [Streptomyces sp. NPDC054784]
MPSAHRFKTPAFTETSRPRPHRTPARLCRRKARPTTSVESGADGSEAAPRKHTGTLLRRSGRTGYTYDGQGRLVRETRKLLDGRTRNRTYTWNAHDQLTDVTTYDGEHWRYTYDALGRRTTKRLLASDGGASPSAPDLTFAWDGTRLAEQVTADGHTTTWDHVPGTHTPVAQTTRHVRSAPTGPPSSPIAALASATAAAEAPTFHAVLTDHTGTPTELVTPDGDIAWQLRTTLWGTPLPGPARSTTTVDCPLRFPGQYADPETGLHYNYFRYYDPHTTRYLTPDPLGLSPAPNPHTYITNPHAETDPHGLAPCKPSGYSPTVTQRGLEHSYDRHAAQWFGREVPKADKLEEWRAVIDRATGKIKFPGVAAAQIRMHI